MQELTWEQWWGVVVDPGSIVQEIKKKVILLRNFKNYMTTDALERKDFHFLMCFEMHGQVFYLDQYDLFPKALQTWLQ